MNLYDRQIRTYGMDALLKITSSSTLIYGLEGGLATEVGKNLALGGIKNLYLFDDKSIINNDDLLTGYYYIDSLKKNRAKILSVQLQKLNQYCTVKTTKSINMNQNVTIIINKSLDEINNLTKQLNSKIVILYSKFINQFGANGCLFVDAGINHNVVDATGEQIDPVHIKSISQNGEIICTHNHGLDDNNIITFYNLEGENLEQFNNEFFIKVINKNTLKIDTKLNPFKLINGMIKIIKKSIIINHLPFSEYNSNNTLDDITKYYLSLKSFDGLYDFMPTVSLFGSLGASEVIKLITNKYMPCNQWLSWNDDKVTFNTDFKDVKLFVVGSGAIGCELLKNFAMLNIGNIIITDPDNIERSNLNRQFLFRDEDINKPKSQVAAKAIKQMNPNINIKALLEKVGPNNINFTDSLLGSDINIVFNALDNINARKFMDEQCLRFGLPLFETGTTGTKGNTQPVIPFITETYSASSDPDTEKTYPVCTIKSFPNEISHTIHWALDQFELFNKISNNLNKYLQDSTIINSLDEIESKYIKMLTTIYDTQHNINDCIDFSIRLFNELYYDNINKLLSEFPKDHKLDNGDLFWSGGKKCPEPIKLDLDNEYHLDFIINTSKLIAYCSGLIVNITKETIINYKSENESNKSFKLEPIYNSDEFDKDNELHINWINSASNLRAINYNIVPVDIYETKGIAGKIIPAIATTTSAVAGLIIMEFIKYLNKCKLEDYRSTFINLADPMIVYSEPLSAPMLNIAGVKINSWTQFKYSVKSTLKEFKEYYDKLFETDINMIVFDSAMVYADFLGEEALEKPLIDIITDLELNKKSTIIASIFNENENELPNIILHF